MPINTNLSTAPYFDDFDLENQLTLWSEERDSEIETDIQQADWKIDIEGQLIIVFDEEDWFHARVMSDVIGGDMMEVKEYDGDDYVYHTLVKASVITPEQLVEAPNFILTSEVQENCSITFNTGITADNFAQNLKFRQLIEYCFVECALMLDLELGTSISTEVRLSFHEWS